MYGPASKSELDQWVAEQRITADCQIRRQGTEAWQPAVELYPELAPAAAPAEPEPQPAAASSPEDAAWLTGLEPGAGAPAGAGEAAAPLFSPQVGGLAEPTESRRPALPQRSQFRPRSYAAMDLASRIYRTLGWVMIGLGVLAAVIAIPVFILMVLSASQMGAIGMLSAAGAGLVLILTGLLYLAITVITLWFAADAIRCLLDIQNNTHEASFWTQQLAAREERK
jgi:hypothetical protein